MSKTIFITMSDGEVSKSILFSDIYKRLSDEASVVFLVPSEKVSYFKGVINADAAIIEAMPKALSPFIEELFADLFLYSVPTESLLIKIRHSKASGGSMVGKAVKIGMWFFGHFALYRRFLRFVYQCIPDHTFDALFAKYSPALVFAANLTSSEDARLLRASKRREVATVGIPKGWDNLTLKTLLPVFPELLIVQTDAMKGDAIALDYPAAKIQVVGFPKFDVYAHQAQIESREEFMARFNFDPKRKLILYAGAGDQLAPHDEEILADLFLAIDNGVIPGSPQVLVRPHPKYKYRSEILPVRDFWALDRPGKSVGSQNSNFEFDESDVLHLMSSLYHADLIIHTASTLGVEGAVFDKPIISLAYDGPSDIQPDLSTARYYKYTHMRRVVQTGGMKVAYSFEELCRFVCEYLESPSLDHEGRMVLKSENAHIIDGKAGARVAESILGVLNTTPAK